MLEDFFTNDENSFSTISLNPNGTINQGTSSNDDCRKKISINSSCVNDFPLAMAYVPMQKFQKLYSPEKALAAGTLFEELDLPFYGGSKRSGGTNG